MFAAVLVVCSLSAPQCELALSPPIFPDKLACEEAASQYVSHLKDELTSRLGLFEVDVWCRQLGRPA